MILAGDVGGTKIRLALARRVGIGVEFVRTARYPSEGRRTFEEIVRGFLAEEPGRLSAGVERACFGIAGPVVDGEVQMPNLPWELDADLLAAALDLPAVHFLNDLEATAYGLEALPAPALATLQEGRRRGPTAALLAAGTGLGAAIVTRVAGRALVLPSEAGHVGFAPRDEFEVDLLGLLRERYGRVSAERVVSGPGLSAIYDCLRDSGREVEPARLADRLAGSRDRNAMIGEIALAGEAPICVTALERFAAAYGAQAGDLALASLALAGVYLGGGIAPRILPALQSSAFLEAFRSKGRMSELVADIPIRVVLEPRAALIGAACYAASIA